MPDASFPPDVSCGKVMFVGAAGGARRFFWTLPCFHFGFGTRTETEESSPPKEKIGRVSRRSAPHTRGIRMCQKAAPVAHSLSCLRFFGRSSHIPRLFLLLVSVPSRLLFSEIAAPATFFILRRASRHLLTRQVESLTAFSDQPRTRHSFRFGSCVSSDLPLFNSNPFTSLPAPAGNANICLLYRHTISSSKSQPFFANA